MSLRDWTCKTKLKKILSLLGLKNSTKSKKVKSWFRLNTGMHFSYFHIFVIVLTVISTTPQPSTMRQSIRRLYIIYKGPSESNFHWLRSLSNPYLLSKIRRLTNSKLTQVVINPRSLIIRSNTIGSELSKCSYSKRKTERLLKGFCILNCRQLTGQVFLRFLRKCISSLLESLSWPLLSLEMEILKQQILKMKTKITSKIWKLKSSRLIQGQLLRSKWIII